MLLRFTAALAALHSALAILPIDTPQCLTFSSGNGAIALVTAGQHSNLPPILTTADDWPGVRRAAGDLATDFERTTGTALPLHNVTSTGMSSKTAIIVTTLGQSSLAATIAKNAKIDTSSIAGKWESFILRHVANPLPGVSDALVIIGADKRGSIFGLYTLSEQLGVSPWYYWTDTAPVKRTQGVFIPRNANCDAGSPTVQYRGLFLNDEQPALTNWANEKLRPAGSTLPTFRSNFYVLMFETILRLKANTLWPAIWASMFAVDDPMNQPLADMYGVVMSTSHQEPMMRSTPNEWNLDYPGDVWDFNTDAANITQFWLGGTERAKPFESIYSMGMRGAGDLPLGPTTNIQLLENIINVQRGLISQVYNITDQTSVPQVWCLYKEVQTYYNLGMRVPDDITLLWTDDNWGHIQRLPSDSERNRWGGAGVYFHTDYVGSPRDYKWINTVNNVQSWQQLNLAVEWNATRVWILNVGDFKGVEVAVDLFVSMAYNASAFNRNNLLDYQTAWAAREFQSTELAPQIATLVQNFTRLTAMRKPELVDPTTFSIVNYREADTIAAQWTALANTANEINGKLPAAVQPSFFETVLHPVLATGNVHQLYIAAARNQLLTSQSSSSANVFASQMQTFFKTDIALRNQYHTLLGGKWNHMMDQTHLGYYYWQQPMQDTLPPIGQVFMEAVSLGGSMRLTVENSLGAWPGDNMNDCSQMYSCPDPTIQALSPFGPTSRFVEISPSGPNTFTWTTNITTAWLKVSQTQGTLHPTDLPTRIELSVDWSKVPTSANEQFGTVRFISSTGEGTTVTLPVWKTSVPADFHGFVEGDGVVSFEAAHWTRNTAVNGVSFVNIPSFGSRAFDGVTHEPALVGNFTPAGTGPSMEFDFFTFNSPSSGAPVNLSVTTYLYSSFNLLDYGPCLYGISLDGGAVQTVQPIPNLLSGQYTPPDWDTPSGAAANAVRSVLSSFANVSPGKHTLKISMITPGLIFEKFVLNLGGLQASYLGPPESSHV